MTNSHSTPTSAEVPQTIMSRRRALGFLVTATGAALLAACGPGAAPVAPTTAPAAPTTAAAAKPTAAAAATTAPAAAGAATTPPQPAATVSNAPAPTAAAQAQAKTGGTLRWGQVGDLATIDAILWSPVSNNTLGQVNEMLIDYDDDLNIMPRLAESWDLSTDNKSIKLNLRKGVTVPLRPRVHQRRRRIQPAARARSEEPVSPRSSPSAARGGRASRSPTSTPSS